MTEPGPVFFDENQLSLLGEADLGAALFSEEEVKEGRYTATRLRNTRPELYQLCVTLLAEGIPFRQITRATGMHHYTIQAVMAAEPELIEAETKRLAGLMKVGRTVMAEKVLEALPYLDIKNVRDLQGFMISLGILTEKAELLAGNATQRIARPQEERLEDLADHFKQLPSAPIEAEFQDITSFAGDAAGTKEGNPAMDQGSASEELPEPGSSSDTPENAL